MKEILNGESHKSAKNIKVNVKLNYAHWYNWFFVTINIPQKGILSSVSVGWACWSKVFKGFLLSFRLGTWIIMVKKSNWSLLLLESTKRI